VRNRLLKDDVYVLRGVWPPAECDALAAAARAAAAASGGWRTGRHAAFPTVDALPPAEAAALRAAVRDRVLRRSAARRVPLRLRQSHPRPRSRAPQGGLRPLTQRVRQ
jgi:hypothetical protein